MVSGLLPLFLLGLASVQAVEVVVDPSLDRLEVSPSIYGRNNNLPDSSSQVASINWQRYRDAGLRLCREGGGNNATKYNWKLKLGSHPDWYNNVYAHDWDVSVQSLEANLPGVQGMWSFQLIGKAAGSSSNNFADWAYNQSQWWSGIAQNLAGGGTVNPAGGGQALIEGDTSKYLVDWTADDSVGILDHWLSSASGLGVDRTTVRYWNMDNEPEIWDGTHDDVMPTNISAEAFMQRFFEVAKKARAKYPDIRIVGPVPANEWQWYNWPGGAIVAADGRSYCWLEYFIKRVAEEQRATGLRLLNVIDIHYYPSSSDPATILQFHRVFFDRNYVYPEANGVHAVNGNWDNAINKEYILGRCQDWLTQYIGADHGVGLGVTESGLNTSNANVAALWYASTLGEFMRNGAELFTPWTWHTGMWEVLHLYSRYNYSTCVRTTSSDETRVSSYATVSKTTGNLSVVLVNRSLSGTTSVHVSLANSGIPDGLYQTLGLYELPASETFVSHTTNALRQGTITVSGGAFNINLAPLSITTVLLRPVADQSDTPLPAETRFVNLSVRSVSSLGGGELIMGFVVSGPSTTQLLLRGTGPALIPFGVATPVPNPILALFAEDQSVLQQNDDWGSATLSPEISAFFATLGAFPLPDGALDSALLTTLPTGNYTAQVIDAGGTTGVALGEAYVASADAGTRLVNVSGRAWVGLDVDKLIAGFTIQGPGPKTVLVRAVGPGLDTFGVPGTLQNPVLKIFHPGGDTPLWTNDDWGNLAYADEVEAKSQELHAFPLTRGSKDAVLLLTLAPGLYTAEVTGSANETGVALVEVYEAD